MYWANTEKDYLYFTEMVKKSENLNEAAQKMKEIYAEIKDAVADGTATKEQSDIVLDVGSDWRVDWYAVAESFKEE